MPEVSGLSPSIAALEAALERYEESVASAQEAFAAATEAAMWVIAIDSALESRRDDYRRRRDADARGKVIPLIRVYRNQILHAVESPSVSHTGAFSPEFSREFDRVRLEWVDPDAKKMHKGDRRHLERCRDELVGREVSRALTNALAFIREEDR